MVFSTVRYHTVQESGESRKCTVAYISTVTVTFSNLATGSHPTAICHQTIAQRLLS